MSVSYRLAPSMTHSSRVVSINSTMAATKMQGVSSVVHICAHTLIQCVHGLQVPAHLHPLRNHPGP
jgi:hypothetical protein